MRADLSGFTIDTSDCGSLTSLELYNLHTTNRNFPVIQTKGLKNLTELALSDFVIEGSLGDLNNQIRRYLFIIQFSRILQISLIYLHIQRFIP